MADTSDTRPVRVRFAPSPTGYLHVGGARTALFNWLYARHTGGKFLLRIEDTDLERSTPESVQQILDSLAWLGMEADEPVEYQTRRVEQHKVRLAALMESGAAYHDYCTKARLDELRAEATAAKRAFVYRRELVTDDEMESYRKSGEAGVIRLRGPLDGTTAFDDMVYGHIAVPNETIGDFVIARADGSPLYNFSNTVDDIDMGITDVCRGEDHVTNTTRQILVYQALGATPPRFAHLPLILGTDKKRFSKRHGATSVMEFKSQGILPEALTNFLSLLGWAPEGSEFDEVMTSDELAEKFTLEKVNRSAAVFDYEKLGWMNGMYIRRLPKEIIYSEVVPDLDATYGATDGPFHEHGRAEWLRAIIDLEIERSRSMRDFTKHLEYFFIAPTEYEEKSAKKLFATQAQLDQLGKVAELMGESWPTEEHADRDAVATALDTALRAWCETNGVKFGNAVHPVRLAATGRTASPPLFDVLYHLGKVEVLKRMQACVDFHRATAGS